MSRVLSFLLIVCLCAACQKDAGGVEQARPSVYYWRTTFALDSTERTFLQEHQIGKLYLRFFDVAQTENEAPHPVATLAFRDTLPPQTEVIPVVFIIESCLYKPPTDFAEKIVNRVLQMCETHDVRNVHELQIDCDWTSRSQKAYFRLLEEIRSLLARRGLRLSATIRLHQLSMAVPPVDYGVLMLYNTGDPRNRRCRNPILSETDVRPYVRHLAHYALPLCAAYPDYRWQRLFGGDRFKGFLYEEDLSDTLVYRRVREDAYLVVQSRYISTFTDGQTQSDIHLSVGDSVFVSTARPETIRRVAALLGEARPSLHNQVILYPLDTKNIRRQTFRHYETLFHP